MTGISKRFSLEQKRERSAWILIAPAFIVIFLVAGWPLLRTIYFSLTDTSLTNLYGGKWVGIDNYISFRQIPSGKIIWRGTLADSRWWNSVWNTFYFTSISVTIETIFGLCIALILNANFIGRGILRAAILIPWAIPTIVSAKMWSWMLNDQIGVINDILFNTGIITEKIAWTSNSNTSIYALIMVDIWKTTPFMSLLSLAALQMVPKDIKEAATLDGVSPFRIFFKITLPLIKPALTVAIIFRTLDALRIFDLVYVLTPNSYETKTMSVISRENLIEFDKFAYGSAQSTLIFIIIALFVILVIHFSNVNFGDNEKR